MPPQGRFQQLLPSLHPMSNPVITITSLRYNHSLSSQWTPNSLPLEPYHFTWVSQVPCRGRGTQWALKIHAWINKCSKNPKTLHCPFLPKESNSPLMPFAYLHIKPSSRWYQVTKLNQIKEQAAAELYKIVVWSNELREVWPGKQLAFWRMSSF